jgi:hypothetical protein
LNELLRFLILTVILHKDIETKLFMEDIETKLSMEDINARIKKEVCYGTLEKLKEANLMC